MPDAKPAITHLRNTFENKTVEEARALLLPIHIILRFGYMDAFRRGARIARDTGNAVDAEWLERKHDEIFAPDATVLDMTDPRGGRAERRLKLDPSR
ncbi:hypothetical protein LTR85_007748 [Meristemomyces frigidus]|nr:hypothetical protein LTR85_007748 [Meristemomyces frigidus]